ncbi:MAG: HU family DNA-binding protein [Candidatus Latescibacterota bacterium]
MTSINRKYVITFHEQTTSITSCFVLAFAAMRDSLIEGNRIEIRGFGVFQVKDTRPKPAARNPRTGEIIYVPARRKTHFKPGRLLKGALHEVRSAEGESVGDAPPDAERTVSEHS